MRASDDSPNPRTGGCFLDPESLQKQEFLKQFEPDGEDFIFRPNLRAPGVRVTRAERDRLMEERKTRSRRQVWIAVPAMMGIIIGYSVAENYLRFAKPFEMPVIVGLTMVVVFFVVRRELRFERRALQEFLKDRPIVAPARTREEGLRAHFRQMTWSQIGALAGLLVAVTLRGFARHHLSLWENRFWLLCAAIFFFFLFAAIAYRKWRWSGEE